jgi:chromosomal replication initiation ATPase DnaA
MRAHNRNIALAQRVPRLSTIVEATAVFYGLTEIDLVAGPRQARIVRARRVAAVLMRELNASYSEIGEALGYTDHTTALKAVTEMTELAKTDETLRAELGAIREAAKRAMVSRKSSDIADRLHRLEFEVAALRNEIRRGK